MKIKNYKPNKKHFETSDKARAADRNAQRKNARAAKNALKWAAMYDDRKGD